MDHTFKCVNLSMCRKDIKICLQVERCGGNTLYMLHFHIDPFPQSLQRDYHKLSTVASSPISVWTNYLTCQKVYLVKNLFTPTDVR